MKHLTNAAPNKPFILWSRRVFNFYPNLSDPERDPLIPVGIRFVPTKAPRDWFDQTLPCVKAVAMFLNGEESAASSIDITAVTGRLFFDSDTQRIPLLRLKVWCAGALPDEEIFHSRWTDIQERLGERLQSILGQNLYEWQRKTD